MKIFVALLGISLLVAVKADLAEEGDAFEGDILLTPVQKMLIEEGRDLAEASLQRGASINRQWPGGIVPYVIDQSLAQYPSVVSVIQSAIKEWSDKTCIKFVKRTTERGYISFVFGLSCASLLGYAADKQKIELGSLCWQKGIIVHEIGHALGFWHEQSRPDRDSYVTIMWNNIISGFERNFKKYTDSEVDSLGVPYDYESIMHYGRKAFAKQGTESIVPKDKNAKIGQRDGLSILDAKQANLLYKCDSGGIPLPTSAPCMDTIDGCERYKFYCKTNEYTRTNCKQTCGLC